MVPDLDRWSLVSLSARVSDCGIFLSSPQSVVPDSPSGVDFLSPVLPTISCRVFRPLIFHFLRTALRTVPTASLQLVVLWMITNIALSI